MVAFIGCAQREVSKVDPINTGVNKEVISLDLNRGVDILFVIDNSDSMKDEQTSLVKNFRKFINELEKIDGGLPDVHIGVISTDLGKGDFHCDGNGDNGQLQTQSRPEPNAPACIGLSDTGESFFKDINNGANPRTRNYDPEKESLADRFACVARLGIDGCNFEQPLEAIKRALDPALNTNPGFLIDDRHLAVIIVSDEDDCSVANDKMVDEANSAILSSFLCFEHGVVCDGDQPRDLGAKRNCQPRPGVNSQEANRSKFMTDVDEYVSFLFGLKANPGLIIVSTITATEANVSVVENSKIELDEQCNTPGIGKAFPAIRLRHFANQFPSRNTTTSICQAELAGALQQIGTLIRNVVGNSCVRGDIDIDPDTPGVQYECVVANVTGSGSDQEIATSLPECSSQTPKASELPCWYFNENPKCSEEVTGFELVPVGSDQGATLRLECVAAP